MLAKLSEFISEMSCRQKWYESRFLNGYPCSHERLKLKFILTFTKALRRRHKVFLLAILGFTTILHHFFGICYLFSNHCTLFAVT